MKIGIIGSGAMGANMGRLWAQAGHKVLFSYSRDIEKLKQVAAAAGPQARYGNPEEAVAFGDVVVLSVPCTTVDNALQAAGPIENKILFSCVNALKPDMSGLAVGTTTSIAGQIPKARG